MATIVSLHAHPDDESIQTGGSLALAGRAGHRTVLVFGTRGEHGEVVEGFLEPGETLGARREQECHRSAEVLGVQRVAFLDYVDSGMAGTPENDLPGSFWSADLDEAAERLAAILREEQADVLTVYDENGVYGHPDHLQVHRVGLRAAALAGTPIVLEATMNRDELRRVIQLGRERGVARDEDVPDVGEDSTFGSPEAVITHRIDVRDVLDLKRASMAAHASQISETSFFLQMPDEGFEATFGREWYIRHGASRGGDAELVEDLLDGLA
jgi:LmbE family N-acetylglucosaminyl deacetylase